MQEARKRLCVAYLCVDEPLQDPLLPELDGRQELREGPRRLRLPQRAAAQPPSRVSEHRRRHGRFSLLRIVPSRLCLALFVWRKRGMVLI